MDRFTRFDLIEDALEKAQAGKEVYLNLYPSEIRKIEKRYPDVQVISQEVVDSPKRKNRKVWCCLKAKI